MSGRKGQSACFLVIFSQSCLLLLSHVIFIHDQLTLAAIQKNILVCGLTFPLPALLPVLHTLLNSDVWG